MTSYEQLYENTMEMMEDFKEMVELKDRKIVELTMELAKRSVESALAFQEKDRKIEELEKELESLKYKMKNEWCYDHEQLMWKNGLKCSGCLDDEEEEPHRNVKIPCNKCGREVWCEEDTGYGCICFKCQEIETDDERYCDNEECPYGSYICFEELEKYRNKDWTCDKCKNEKTTKSR